MDRRVEARSMLGRLSDRTAQELEQARAVIVELRAAKDAAEGKLA